MKKVAVSITNLIFFVRLNVALMTLVWKGEEKGLLFLNFGSVNDKNVEMAKFDILTFQSDQLSLNDLIDNDSWKR